MPAPRLASGKWGGAVLSGLGGFLAVFILAELTAGIGTILLIAPFGASCVLLFALPQSPLAQPRNVIGGHVVSTCVGLAVLAACGSSPISLGLAVGLAIIAMQMTGTLHPPAGADPIVVIMAGADWWFLLTPVLAGTGTLVLAAVLFHRILSGRSYPAGRHG